MPQTDYFWAAEKLSSDGSFILTRCNGVLALWGDPRGKAVLEAVQDYIKANLGEGFCVVGLSKIGTFDE